MKTTSVAALAGLCFAAAAAAQPIPVHNGGFEIENPDFSEWPEGWNLFNTSVYTVGGPAHSGNASMELASGDVFVGISTNLFDPNGDLYDPPIVFRGGSITVRGWYMIPADQPLVDVNAGFKFEFRRVPPNFSIYQQFEELNISGTTNGQWVQHEMTFDCSRFEDHDGTTESVSILALRFGSGTGTIFWDDIELFQCRADFNCDNSLTTADFTAFRNAYLGGDLKADINGDETLSTADFTAFRNAYLAGCP